MPDMVFNRYVLVSITYFATVAIKNRISIISVWRMFHSNIHIHFIDTFFVSEKTLLGTNTTNTSNIIWFGRTALYGSPV